MYRKNWHYMNYSAQYHFSPLHFMLYRGKSITFGVWSACTENKTAHLISNYLHVTYSTYSISYHMAQNVWSADSKCDKNIRVLRFGYCWTGTAVRVLLYCCTVMYCTVYSVHFTVFPGFSWLSLSHRHRRRIDLEDKAKVVTYAWGAESLPR